MNQAPLMTSAASRMKPAGTQNIKRNAKKNNIMYTSRYWCSNMHSICNNYTECVKFHITWCFNADLGFPESIRIEIDYYCLKCHIFDFHIIGCVTNSVDDAKLMYISEQEWVFCWQRPFLWWDFSFVIRFCYANYCGRTHPIHLRHTSYVNSSVPT